MVSDFQWKMGRLKSFQEFQLTAKLFQYFEQFKIPSSHWKIGNLGIIQTKY